MRRVSVLAAMVCLALLAIAAFVPLGIRPASGILPEVRAQGGCNLGTLTGRYGFAGDGFSTSGPVPATISAFTPVAAVGVDAFDGAGNLSGFITASFGGSISTSTISGTYTVAADCTGSATANLSSGSVIHFSFVIVDHGRQMRNLGTDSGAVSFATAVKQ